MFHAFKGKGVRCIIYAPLARTRCFCTLRNQRSLSIQHVRSPKKAPRSHFDSGEQGSSRRAVGPGDQSRWQEGQLSPVSISRGVWEGAEHEATTSTRCYFLRNGSQLASREAADMTLVGRCLCQWIRRCGKRVSQVLAAIPA